MARISRQQQRWRLAHRHRLIAAERTDDVGKIANDLIALHSSDPATVYLSAAARMINPVLESVDHALYETRSLVRHHAMRRTLWVMAPDIARLAHGASTAKVARAERKRTEAAFATTADIADPAAWLDDALAKIITLLDAQGELSTRDIGKALPELVVPVTFGVNTKNPAALNAHTKVLQGAGFDGALVRGRPTGNWISAEYQWNPTEHWLGQTIAGLEERPAAAELLHRWLLRFGPATAVDIRWWFGWTAGLATKALADSDAVEVALDDDQTGFVALGDTEAAPDPGPWVRLLPGLDPTAMGWKERDWYLDPALVPRLFDRFGNAGPTVWVDGQIVGGWIQRPTGEIAVELATDLGAEHQRLLNEAIEQLQHVLGDVVVRPRFPAPVQKALFAS